MFRRAPGECYLLPGACGGCARLPHMITRALPRGGGRRSARSGAQVSAAQVNAAPPDERVAGDRSPGECGLGARERFKPRRRRGAALPPAPRLARTRPGGERGGRDRRGGAEWGRAGQRAGAPGAGHGGAQRTAGPAVRGRIRDRPAGGGYRMGRLEEIAVHQLVQPLLSHLLSISLVSTTLVIFQ